MFMAIIFCSNFVQAQHWGVQTTMLLQPIKKSFDNGFEGASIQVNYRKAFNEKTILLAGIEGQVNSWANHALLVVGGEYTYFKNKRWSSNVLLNLGNGVAFFDPNALYSFNSKGQVFWNYHTKNENSWGIGVGLQYFVTPKYNVYSSIYSSVNVPVTIQYNF